MLRRAGARGSIREVLAAMVIDSSALIAMLNHEPGAETLAQAVVASRRNVVPATALLEAALVLAKRRGPGALAALSGCLAWSEALVPAFRAEHWAIAFDAFLRFGKGRHPAGLNFGDCLTYAIARSFREPLLFTGNDFRKTDLIPVL